MNEATINLNLQDEIFDELIESAEIVPSIRFEKTGKLINGASKAEKQEQIRLRREANRIAHEEIRKESRRLKAIKNTCQECGRTKDRVCIIHNSYNQRT